jgi:hypothetical protein
MRDAEANAPDAEQQRARQADRHERPVARSHLVEPRPIDVMGYVRRRPCSLTAPPEEALRGLDCLEQERREHEECAHSDRYNDVAQRDLLVILERIGVLVDRCGRKVSAGTARRFRPSRFPCRRHDDHKQDVQEQPYRKQDK